MWVLVGRFLTMISVSPNAASSKFQWAVGPVNMILLPDQYAVAGMHCVVLLVRGPKKMMQFNMLWQWEGYVPS